MDVLSELTAEHTLGNCDITMGRLLLLIGYSRF